MNDGFPSCNAGVIHEYGFGKLCTQSSEDIFLHPCTRLPGDTPAEREYT